MLELRTSVLLKLVDVLRRDNTFYKQLKPAFELFKADSGKTTIKLKAATIEIVYDSANISRAFIKPTRAGEQEVYGLYPNNVNRATNTAFFEVAKRNRSTEERAAKVNKTRNLTIIRRSTDSSTSIGLRSVNRFYLAYVPLYYVLLQVKGTPGYSQELKRSENSKRYVTLRDYQRYLVYKRIDVFPTLFQGRRLFQQLLVDIQATINLNTVLQYIYNQDKLRYVTSRAVRDYIQELQRFTTNRGEPYNLGRYRQVTDLLQESRAITYTVDGAYRDVRGIEGVEKLSFPKVLLLSSYTGSNRQIYQQYKDSIALVEQFSILTLFITMTTNPNQPEIQDCLFYNQKQQDRPDIIARVFILKSKAFLEDISSSTVFRTYVARAQRLEYQKRSLLYIYVVVQINKAEIPTDPAVINSFISAEYPSKEVDLDGSLRKKIRLYITYGPYKGQPYIGSDKFRLAGRY